MEGEEETPLINLVFILVSEEKKKKKPERKDTELSGSWATGQWVLWFVTQEDLFRLFDDKCLFSRQINEGQSCSLCLFFIIRW